MPPKAKAATKRKGRPPKTKKPAEETVTEAIEKPVEETITYNHLRYQRCNTKLNTRSHPAFLHDNMICNTIMQSYKTTDAGKMKHYKCPRCKAVKIVEGEKV